MITAAYRRYSIRNACYNNCMLQVFQQQSLSTATATKLVNDQECRPRPRPIALVMGVANSRSIAWACVESFLRSDYDCILTYHIPTSSNRNDDEKKYRSKIENLASTYMHDIYDITRNEVPQILACLPCNAELDIPLLCSEDLPKLLLRCNHRKLDAIVHSVAYGPEIDRPLLQTSLSAFCTAQHISAYSLIEIVRECMKNNLLSPKNAAITTLSYLGAIRAVPGYGNMGAAKASLESIVRTLAAEVGSLQSSIRVNAISAGPIKTISSRGIPNFASIQNHVAQHSPLQRNITVEEVAETIKWISSPCASGITGQIIYVDAGYSAIVPVTSSIDTNE